MTDIWCPPVFSVTGHPLKVSLILDSTRSVTSSFRLKDLFLKGEECEEHYLWENEREGVCRVSVAERRLFRRDHHDTSSLTKSILEERERENNLLEFFSSLVVSLSFMTSLIVDDDHAVKAMTLTEGSPVTDMLSRDCP